MKQKRIKIHKGHNSCHRKDQATYINSRKDRIKDRLLNIIIAVLAVATTVLAITVYLIYPVLHLVYNIGRPVM